MKKRIVVCVLVLSMVMSGCSFGKNGGNMASDAGSVASGSVSAENTDEGKNAADGAVSGKVYLLGDSEVKYYDENLVPAIPDYTIKEDFSNVVFNSHQDGYFNLENQSEYNDVQARRDAIIKNGFVVEVAESDEFFEEYEENRYELRPNFVTVDSLMHTYHLYFSYLMKQTEKNHLTSELKKLGAQMLESTKKQYDALKGTEFEAAALKNAEFFYIGSKLVDDGVVAPISDGSFDQVVNDELSKIAKAEGVATNGITGKEEDYSQYKPRGYYEGDAELEKYFRAMMWYGRTAFAFDNEELVRAGLLQSLAIA